jgi:hypothetical protein
MSSFAIRLSVLTVCAASLLAVPSVTPAKASQKHLHQRHWRHHAGVGWQVQQPAVGTYRLADGPVCPTIGKSFDCKIWPPPYADDPDRKTRN